MKKDLVLQTKDISSSLLSCETDCETILRKLFVESNPYSQRLKRLLVINTKDCLDNYTNEKYKEKIKQATLPWLKQNDYIRLVPKLFMQQHQEVKSYIILNFDNFFKSANPQFRDGLISFDILCFTDYWDLGDYRVRPLKIAGFIDGILNKARLSGIGKLEFVSCKMLLLDETLSGYRLIYKAVHGVEDYITQQGNEQVWPKTQQK